jgi:hypothetical protein
MQGYRAVSTRTKVALFVLGFFLVLFLVPYALPQDFDQTAESDSPARDAFGRQRVSQTEDLFSATLQYDLQPLMLFTTVANGGTVTHLPAQSSATLAVTSTANSSTRLESRQYIRYLPGRSQLVALTGVLGAAQTGVTKRVGYFDANDGIYFQQTTTGVSWCLRTSTSGSAVSTCVGQASWNIANMLGPQGTTLDPTKAQIWVIDLQWLGMGRVRVGFDIGGTIQYNHEFLDANLGTAVYMKTANLPVAWEIVGAANAGSMQATCVDVTSEGGFHFDRGLQFAAATGATGVTVSATETLLLALRPSASMPQGGSIANQGVSYLTEVGVFASSNDAYYWRLVYGGTLNNTGWAAVDATNSGMEVSSTTTYTAATGVTIMAGYTSGAGSRVEMTKLMISKLPLVLNGFGTVNSVANRGNVVLLATHIGASTGPVHGAIDWVELR